MNRAGFKVLQPIRWWVSYHPDAFYHEAWNVQRRNKGGNQDYTVVTHQRHVGLERSGLDCRQFAGPSCTGSSALLAVLFGLSQGYGSILLAGVPLSGDYETFRDGWRLQANVLRGRVRSLSGWTKTFLEGL